MGSGLHTDPHTNMECYLCSGKMILGTVLIRNKDSSDLKFELTECMKCVECGNSDLRVQIELNLPKETK